MITVKAFDKNLNSDGIQFKIGREYKLPKEKIKIYKFGFHTSAHCNMSEITHYYSLTLNPRYCLVDINVIEEDNDIVVGDKIKIIKELDFNECIKYDKTGEWCLRKAISNKNNIKILKTLENAIIQKDKDGYLCYQFMKYIPNYNFQKLKNTIIQKDKDGYLCYQLAKYFTNINTEEMGDILIKKNVDISIYYKFALDVYRTNKIENMVIKKDQTGEWCYKFARDIINANVKKLQKAVIEKDQTGKWCYLFTRDVKNANIKKIKNILIKKGENNFYYRLFIKNIIKRKKRYYYNYFKK